MNVGARGSMARPSRSHRRNAAREPIATRLYAKVLVRFRKEARRHGVGCQTLINEVLAAPVR